MCGCRTNASHVDANSIVSRGKALGNARGVRSKYMGMGKVEKLE